MSALYDTRSRTLTLAGPSEWLSINSPSPGMVCIYVANQDK